MAVLTSITESEVKSLSGEVSDNVGSVTSPQGKGTFALCGSAKAVDNTVVLLVETASLQHFILLNSQHWFNVGGLT